MGRLAWIFVMFAGCTSAQSRANPGRRAQPDPPVVDASVQPERQAEQAERAEGAEPEVQPAVEHPTPAGWPAPDLDLDLGVCSLSAPELFDDARPGPWPPLTFSAAVVDAYEPLGQWPYFADRLREQVRTPHGVFSFEVDGDGRADHLATVIVDEQERECWLLAVVWGDGRGLQILDHASSCHEPLDESDHFGPWRYGLRNVCADSDGDGRIEFRVGDGPETQYCHATLEWNGTKLAPFGKGQCFGD